MGIITLSLLNALNTTLGVEDKLRLFALKRDTATFGTGGIKNFIEVVQLFDVLNQRRILLAQILIALQYMPDLVIGQTGMGAHYRFVEGITRQTTLCRNGHFADHAQAVNLRVE